LLAGDGELVGRLREGRLPRLGYVDAREDKQVPGPARERGGEGMRVCETVLWTSGPRAPERGRGRE
jgi:hypothetical protein